MPIKGSIHRLCQQCGQPFWTWPYLLRDGFGRYCSRGCTAASRQRTAEERFWDFVPASGPDDCWEWQGGSHTPLGYGQFIIDGRKVYVHRFSWVLHHGAIPDDMVVCHSCDNPPCVNPAHLFLGTKAENTRDMMAKGRHKNGPLSGEANGFAKLTSEEVIEIRRRYAAGVSSRKVAAEFGISKTTVLRIANGTARRNG